HEGAAPLPHEHLRGGVAEIDRPVEIGAQHALPVAFGGLVERAHADDAGIVDDDVEAPEDVHGLLDHGPARRSFGDAERIGDGLAAFGANGLDHHIGGLGRFAVPGDGNAQIVDDDARAEPRHVPADGAADAAAPAGDDGDLALESGWLRRHCVTPSMSSRRGRQDAQRPTWAARLASSQPPSRCAIRTGRDCENSRRFSASIAAIWPLTPRPCAPQRWSASVTAATRPAASGSATMTLDRTLSRRSSAMPRDRPATA